MAALLTMANSASAFHQPAMFAIVADETHFEYVYPEGKFPSMRTTEPLRLEEGAIVKAQTPDTWMQIATANLTQIRFTDYVRVASFEEGVAMAQELFSAPGDTTTQEQDR